MNAKDIRLHTRQVCDGWRKRGLSNDGMIARAEPFRRFVATFAPAWKDEYVACAEAAGVQPDLFEAYLAGKYRDLFFVDECTSFLAVGSATADGATLFHKNRDNVARAQCAYEKRTIDSSRPAGFHSTGDTSDLGLMMMVNEHGLAGSADTGGLAEDRPKGKGVMNPYILRLIAERAERCEDALEIVRQTIKDGWYAGGSKTGTHWLFADRHGKGLRIAQNSHQEKHWFVEDDVAFLARGKTAGAELITRKKGNITLRDMNAAASHPSICFGSSISALTVRVDPTNPGELSSVWFALPAWSPYVPLYPGARGVPKYFIDGTCFQRGYELLEAEADRKWGKGVRLSESVAKRRAATQEELYRDAAAIDRRIRTARDGGRDDQAVKIASEGVMSGCAKLARFLDRAHGGN